MRVFEVMTEDVTTVPPDMPAVDARALMDTSRVHHLIVTSNRDIVGVVSDGDLGATILPGSTVRDVMTAHVIPVEKTETVRKAANLLEGRTIGCLPVTDRGRLVGIITTSDLLRLIGRGVARPETKKRRFANHRVPHRKAHLPSGRW